MDRSCNVCWVKGRWCVPFNYWNISQERSGFSGGISLSYLVLIVVTLAAEVDLDWNEEGHVPSNILTNKILFVIFSNYRRTHT